MRQPALLAVLLLATFLRFYRLDAQSFWNDEGNSARIAERSLPLIIEGAAGDIHPPGYYFLLAAWRAAAGHSEFALRGLSAFAGIILVALVHRLGQQYFDAPAALCAAFFAALHPALIYYSQEARMYELVATIGAATFAVVEEKLFVISYWKSATGDWRLNGALALVLAMGLYTHYSFIFIIVALNVLFATRLIQLRITNNQLLITNLQSLISTFYLPQLLALLLFSPWLPIAIRQVTAWPAERQYPSLIATLFGVFNWLATGPVSTQLAPVGVVSAIFSGIAVIARWKWRAASLWIWLIVPAGLTATLGLFSPAFAKFLIVAVPPVCLLLGGGLTAFFYTAHRPLAKIGATLLLASWVLLACLGVIDIYLNPAYVRADYRGIARHLDSIAKPGDAILLNAPNQWEVFTYYHPDTANVFPIATSRPLNVPEQIAELESIAAKHDRLFVI
ncbi:MAG TPA: glycosyltransferase family 39 protein, partial [Anaerolineales bacterium]|nr:glycosyltransferase family 39 protein [Anaerolineales bacterium]